MRITSAPEDGAGVTDRVGDRRMKRGPRNGKGMTSMRAFRWIALTALAAIAISGVALASGGPTTNQVSGTFSGHTVSDHPVLCTGLDGQYVNDRSVTRGTVQSSDPRLSGNFVNHSRALINLDTGVGRAVGHIVVRDPDTGQFKVKFTTYLVGQAQHDGTVTLKGMEIGTLADGSTLFANSTTTAFPDGTFTGEFGGSPGPTDLAVVQKGSCT